MSDRRLHSEGVEYGTVPDRDAEDGNIWWEHRGVTTFSCFLCLAVISEGYDIGVLNGALVRIKEDLDCTTLEISLIVTMTPLFIMFGAPFGGIVADWCGRRLSLLATCALLTIGPICMAFSTAIWLLIAARALVGLGIGMGYVIVSMYITEVAPGEMRGRLTTLQEVFLNIGMLLGYAMNYLLLGIPNDWRWMIGLGCVLPMVLMIGLLFPQVPESPRWLYMHDRCEEAKAVLGRFLSTKEVRDVIEAMEKDKQAKGTDFVTWSQLVCTDSKVRRRMLAASISVAVAQTACGYLAVGYYSSIILKKAMSEKAAFLATIVMGVVKLVVVLIVVATLESTGRRPMLLLSTTVTVLACIWIACSFWLSWGWLLQAAGFSIFMAGFSLGQGPLTFVYCSEVFTTDLRAKGMGLSLFFSRIAGVLSTLFFPLLVESSGVVVSFFLQATINVLVLGILWWFIVETHGHGIEQMEKLFSS